MSADPLRVVPDAARESYLPRSGELFRAVFDAINVGMTLQSVDHRHTNVNAALCRLLGYSAEELVSLHRRALVHPEDWGKAMVFRDEMRQGRRESAEVEQRLIRKDGAIVWAIVNHTLVRDPGGKPAYIIAAHYDVSESHRSAAALQESEALFRSIFEGTQTGMLVRDLIRGQARYNPALCKLLGYSEAEIASLRMTALTHPDDRTAADERRIRIDQGAPEDGIREVRYIHKDGHVIWVIGNRAVIPDPDGRPHYLVSSFLDVTDQRLMEESLQSALATQTAILNGISYSVIATDASGIIRGFNPAAEKLFGYRAADVIGRETLAILYDLAELSARTAELAETLGVATKPDFSALAAPASRGLPDEREWSMIRRNGARVPVQMAMTALRNEAGVTGFVAIGFDITERKKVERLKSEFVSTVSHELRTPLTTVTGVLGLVRNGVLGEIPERVRTALDMANSNVERLTRLINDILDIEKLEAGQMEISLSPQRLAPLIELSLEMNAAYGRQYGVEFVFTNRAPEAIADLDANRFQQIMANLLSNAAKFSHPGSQVVVSLVPLGDRTSLTVRDFGCGIPTAYQARIFDRFMQVDSSDTRHRGGTGLGLSITKALVQRMNGSIRFDSEVDRGTTFYIEFPRVD